VFVFTNDGGPFGDCVSLHPLLKTAEERTSAIGYVIEHLGEEHIPGIRNEVLVIISLQYVRFHHSIILYVFIIPKYIIYVMFFVYVLPAIPCEIIF
jgi:hypothetical protein